jgi:hypothetical protein
MAIPTAVKIAAAASAVALLATASPAPAQSIIPQGSGITGPSAVPADTPGGTGSPSAELPSRPQYSTVVIGPPPDGISGRFALSPCTDPVSVPVPDGRWFPAVSCDYKISTTDNKLFYDRETCIYVDTKWVFLGLERYTESGYHWPQVSRSYYYPNRVDFGADCIV